MNETVKKVIGTFLFSSAFLSSVVCADTNDEWKYGLSIYGWLPDISGDISGPDGSGGDFTIPISTILENLTFTFQGSFDARKGQWGMFTDVIYMDVNKKEKNLGEGTIGGNDWPYDITAKVGFGMKSWVWTTAAYYRVIEEPEKTFDFLAGVRYIDVTQSLDWSLDGNIGEIPIPGREGDVKLGGAYWDAIVGARGRFAFGQDNAWFMPYYLDIGTGGTDFTWQVAGGIGYTFKWGELTAVWRYLEYNLPSGKAIGDMNFNGPAVGAVFRW